MNYLKQFWTTFKEYFHKASPVKLPNKVNPSEPIGRYLFQSNRFSTEQSRVKYTAFLPPPSLRLSVFRLTGLSENAIWKIGGRIIRESKSFKKFYGVAEIVASTAQNLYLCIKPDKTPPRHANIVGWPEEKSERLLIAKEIAASAKLKLRSQ